jgi:hypothetical protein
MLALSAIGLLRSFVQDFRAEGGGSKKSAPRITSTCSITASRSRTNRTSEHIERLRQVYRAVQARLPFETNAICILPDHLHTIWTLPPGDADFDPTGQPRVQNRPEARAEFWASQGDFAHPTEPLPDPRAPATNVKGQFRPSRTLFEGCEIAVRFNPELPAGRAEAP